MNARQAFWFENLYNFRVHEADAFTEILFWRSLRYGFVTRVGKRRRFIWNGERHLSRIPNAVTVLTAAMVRTLASQRDRRRDHDPDGDPPPSPGGTCPGGGSPACGGGADP